jgi:polysaccharide biosynthesis transport protein
MALDTPKNGLTPYPPRSYQSSLEPIDRPVMVAPQVAPVESESNEEESISLEKILAFLKRRALILGGVSLASSIGLLGLVMTRPPSYVGTFRLLAEPVTKGSQLAEDLTSDAVQSNQASTRKVVSSAANEGTIDYISQIEVLKSQSTLDPIVKEIQASYPKIDYYALLGKMKIVRGKDSKILDFSYSALNPDEIDFALKKLSEGFIRYSIDDRKNNLKEGVKFIEEQIDRQRQEVVKLETKLGVLRRQNSLIDPKTVMDQLADRSKNMMTEQAAIRVKLASAQSLYTNLQRQVGAQPQQALAVANLSESPTYQALITKLRDLDSKIATESARFTDKTPMMEALEDQRRELVPLIQAEADRVTQSSGSSQNATTSLGYQGTVGRDLTRQLVQTANEIEVLQQQSQVLQQQVVTNNQQTQSLAGVAQDYVQIIRNLELATGSLTRLQIARENLQLETARQAAPWRLLSQLDDRSIGIQSNTPMMMLLSILASLVIGLVAALIVEQLDRVFHNVEELKETQLPCLGIIPFQQSLNQETALFTEGDMDLSTVLDTGKRDRKARQNRAAFLESFYTLDANLRLMASDHPIRSVTLTSTSPADGKSTIAGHLAMASATMGRRVLLIDTDLRRPQVHKWFGLQNMRGLSTAITSEMNWHDLVQSYSQDANLSILSAGPMPPSPGRLLSSNKMRQIIEQASEEYDLVICDAPPVIFADAKLVATHTDGILMVVGIGKTDRVETLRALEDLKTTGQVPVLGTVANGVKAESSQSYYYYQRYYEKRSEDAKELARSGSRQP